MILAVIFGLVVLCGPLNAVGRLGSEVYGQY